MFSVQDFSHGSRHHFVIFFFLTNKWSWLWWLVGHRHVWTGGRGGPGAEVQHPSPLWVQRESFRCLQQPLTHPPLGSGSCHAVHIAPSLLQQQRLCALWWGTTGHYEGVCMWKCMCLGCLCSHVWSWGMSVLEESTQRIYSCVSFKKANH